MGHTFALDDCKFSLLPDCRVPRTQADDSVVYDWTPTGITNFIMLAGSSAEITEFDGWMLRNWWYELSRNRGW